jgi:hypothetical protein
MNGDVDDILKNICNKDSLIILSNNCHTLYMVNEWRHALDESFLYTFVFVFF